MAIEIIDCHTHVGTDYFWSHSGVSPNSQSIDQLLKKMDANSVVYAIVFPMASSPYYTKDSLVKGKPVVSGLEAFPYERSNKGLVKQIIELNGLSQSRFFPFFCFSPQDKVTQQIDFLQKSLEGGILRGLKYHPYASQTHLTSVDNKPFLEFAQQNSLSLVLHYGLDKFSKGEGILDLVSKYDQVRFSLAHIARFDENILRSVNQLPNLFFDVSCLSGECIMATGFKLTDVYSGFVRRRYDFQRPLKVLESLVEEFPTSVLWGTDEPFTMLKDGKKVYYCSTYFTETGILLSLDDKDIQIVASQNPRRFLKLN